MIVECIQNRSDNWEYQIDVGSHYLVIEIHIEMGKNEGRDRLSFRLDGEDLEVPALFPSAVFKVVDPSIPRGWVYHRHNDRLTTIGPEAWTREGFWEDFFDDVEAAVDAFEAAIDQMEADH